MLPFPTACLTPAYAGQTVGRDCGLAPSSLYPHARGANYRTVMTDSSTEPSTPAYAGQTETGRPPHTQACLYPRICGANGQGGVQQAGQVPLPPHMRGKPLRRYFTPAMLPSTPAYAGQTMRNGFSIKRRLLYPRICGANAGVMADGGIDKPLPPHMRGKLTGGQSVFVRQASTPAYAGQTGRRHVLDLGHGLYPRICGANHRGRPGTGATLASTPAYAGQTSS